MISRSVHQKTCSQANVMAESAKFFKEIFKMCPNGIIPDLKLAAALKEAHERTPIYFHSQGVSDWASDASTSLRQVARMYRQCKMYEDRKKATLKKALGMNVL